MGRLKAMGDEDEHGHMTTDNTETQKNIQSSYNNFTPANWKI